VFSLLTSRYDNSRHNSFARCVTLSGQPVSKRIGILGGSFDPVHYGHLLLAESAREQCRLDEVWFMPAAVPPHKQSKKMTSAKARLEMLSLAIAGNDAFVVSSIEIDRGGVSYSVETLGEVKSQQPDAELFFLMGGETLNDLPNWREPGRVCELAIPTVVHRAGSPEPNFDLLREFVSNERLDEIRELELEMPLITISGTDIRERIVNSRSIRYLTPRAVEKYIQTNSLYRSA